MKWLQILSDQSKLFLHLDTVVLKGGGYESMLRKAAEKRKEMHKKRGAVCSSILVVDADRGLNGEDGWTLEELQANAKAEDFQLYLQNPNLEGVLVRLLPGSEYKKRDATKVLTQLKQKWPDYDKSRLTAQQLACRFNLQDLQRAAQIDGNLQQLLMFIGLWVER